MDEPDPVAIRAAADGDVDAFTALVVAYQTPVWRFVARLVGDRELAEDVTQETFLRAYRSLGSFGFRSKFSTWLLQIAKNAAIDAQRSRSRRERLEGVLPPPQDTPAGDVASELLSGVDALDERLREALVTVELLGFSYREAGAVLGVPEGTIKSRVHHARLELSRWLRAGEEDASDEL
jgi:RNA polymerase sigma-70 factor (ECF subfamily)